MIRRGAVTFGAVMPGFPFGGISSPFGAEAPTFQSTAAYEATPTWFAQKKGSKNLLVGTKTEALPSEPGFQITTHATDTKPGLPGWAYGLIVGGIVVVGAPLLMALVPRRRRTNPRRTRRGRR